MLKSSTSLLLFTVGIFSFDAPAQNFDTLLNKVVSNNTELMSSVAATHSELLSLKSENNLPDPEVELEYQWGRHEVGDKFDVNVTQGFDWPGVYAARGKANKIASEAMSYLNRSNYIDKRLEIKQTLIDIVNVKKNMAVVKGRLALMDTMIEKYTTGVNNGELTILDLRKLKIEKIRLNESMAALESEFALLKSTLEVQNGGKNCDDIIASIDNYPDDVILPAEEYEKIIEENDPSVKYSSLMMQSQAQRVKAERLTRLPGFTLGYHHSWEDGDVFNGMIVGVTLPFFSTHNKVRAAKALSRSLEYDEMTVAIKKRATAKADREKALALYKQMSAYEAVLKNDNSVDLLGKSLDGGQISLLDYLGEMDYYMQAERDYLAAQYQYHQTLANLNKYKVLD
ncbi:TolC family protein [Barnesiella sp. WM24]|uniref:TolC family protein n=1 Tax=Barnesiella sp. WM24 TaxID=2558278 RepID=UPI001072393D|nr:TolC family protein [Barnesiella sp. WM24]TFU92925.1 TolC family protein [Barnesiella sp. WM24]